MNGVRIEHGDQVFVKKQIKGIKVIQEQDPMSVTLIESVADFTLFSPDGTEYVFSPDVPFLIFFDDQIEAIGYLDTCERINDRTWDIRTTDFTRVLEKRDFPGDVYTDKNANTLLVEIMNAAGLLSVRPDELVNMTVSGRIPFTNCREALSHFMFATGLVMNPKPIYNDGKAYVNFEFYDKEQEPYVLEERRTLSGGKITTDKAYDGVELYVHQYDVPETGESSYSWKWKAPNYKDENVYVVPPEPVYEWDFVKHSGKATYTVLEQNANYVKVSYELYDIYGEPTRSFWCVGKKYNTYSSMIGKYQNDNANIAVIENKTLVSPANCDAVLERCYNYYLNDQKAVVKIVEGKHETSGGSLVYGVGKYGESTYGSGSTGRSVVYDTKVQIGMVVTVPIDSKNTYTGRVVKQQYDLNGSIIIKEITIK